MSTKVDSFLGGSNAIYVDQMYSAWKADPKRYDSTPARDLTIIFLTYFCFHIYSVHASWAAYFSSLDAGVDPSRAFVSLPSVSGGVSAAKSPSQQQGPPVLSDSLGLSYLVSAYQVILY